MQQMAENKTIFVIIGSASQNSANQKIIDNLTKLTQDNFHFTVCTDLKTLPHFDPELSSNNPPEQIIELRNKIEKADGIIICTPEYIFSIPSGLKNVIEWCIATTVFSNKPTGLITASASGKKAHEELQLIMKTAMAKFSIQTTLLIQGVKGKINEQGQIIDKNTLENLTKFANAFCTLVDNN
jgi:chromate reductase